MDTDAVLKKVEEDVCSCDIEGVEQTLPALPENVTPDLVLQALNQGIEKARKMFKDGRYAIPDFLLAIDAYHRGTEYLKQTLPTTAGRQAPRIVIGVVEGDVHDMGKNIVAAVLEASGYQVTNLGYNVSNDTFLEAVETLNPEILALSTMMSTTLDNMKELIFQVKKFYPETLVFVGGAPFDPDLARRIGADGYAENAITTPDETRRILAGASARQLPQPESTGPE